MRSTLKIANNTALDNILDNYARVLKLQNQMSKGRRVVNPKDDPLATNTGMRLDTLIARIEQFDRNITIGTSMLSLSDTSLGEVGELISNAKSLTIGAASDTTSHQMRQANAVEMRNLLAELVTIGNRRDGTRYIFGGTQTQRPPFTVVGSRYVHYQGNEEEIDIQADEATFTPINVTGETIFGSMLNVLETRDLAPDINMNRDISTRLENLNGGEGVPDGSVNVIYSDFPLTGVDIDLSEADTLEDVKDIIERETKAASQALTPVPSTRYVHVSMNADRSGLVLTEYDTALPGPPDVGAPAILAPADAVVEVRETGGGTVARDLGIKGTGSLVGTTGLLVGDPTDPAVTETTLLADLEGYADGPLVILNGEPQGHVSLREQRDVNNITDRWSLHGLTEGITTNSNNEIFTRVSHPTPTSWEVEIFKSETMLPSERIAFGTRDTGGGTVLLEEDNNSGVSGSVSINYVGGVGTSESITSDVTFDRAFQATVNVPAFERADTAAVHDNVANLHLRGLERNVSTGADGEFSIEVTAAGTVNVYSDTAALVATGSIPAGNLRGTAELVGIAPDYTSVLGSVDVDLDLDGDGAADFAGARQGDMRATFATVNDLKNAVDASNTYTTLRIDEDGEGLRFISTLGGAYLTIEEQQTWAPIDADENNLLAQLRLDGVAQGFNTDAGGNLYAEVEDDGTGVEVRFYKDTDHNELVASGKIAAGTGLVTFAEENQSGLSGSVRVLNPPPPYPPPPTPPTTNADMDIVVPLRGMKTQNDDAGVGGAPQLSRLQLNGRRQGINTGVDGELYAEIVENPAGTYNVNLYQTAAMAPGDLVASGSTNNPNDTVDLIAQNGSALSGTVVLDYNADDNDILLTAPRGLGLSGQVREPNIFSTFNDVIDGMLDNDSGTLSELVGNYQTDLDRLLYGRADIGARINRFDMLTQRHADEKINFGKIRADRIDLDFAKAVTDMQAYQNVFEASLRTTSQIIPMSLVDFI